MLDTFWTGHVVYTFLCTFASRCINTVMLNHCFIFCGCCLCPYSQFMLNSWMMGFFVFFFFVLLAQIVTCLACFRSSPLWLLAGKLFWLTWLTHFYAVKRFIKRCCNICFSSKAQDGELLVSSLIGSVTGMLHLGLHGFWTYPSCHILNRIHKLVMFSSLGKDAERILVIWAS